MTLRLNRQDLVELITSMEAGGHDASHLRAVLASLPQPAQPRQGLSRFKEEEELTTAEYLELKVGDLFASGITDEILAQLIEIDRSYSLGDLKEICREAGLSVHGTKKELAAKLLASGQVKNMKVLIEKEVPEEAQMAKQELVDFESYREWYGEPDKVEVPQAYIEGQRYEITVFVQKERGGRDFMFRCWDYKRLDDGQWQFDKVIRDTSIRNPEGKVELTRYSYHPYIRLANVAFMVYPGRPEWSVIESSDAD